MQGLLLNMPKAVKAESIISKELKGKKKKTPLGYLLNEFLSNLCLADLYHL